MAETKVTVNPIRRVRGLVNILRHQASMASTPKATAAYWTADADAIEAVLAERERLMADVDRLRKACLQARVMLHPCAGGCSASCSCSWCVVHAALAATEPQEPDHG